jgi:hypothetical protein
LRARLLCCNVKYDLYKMVKNVGRDSITH